MSIRLRSRPATIASPPGPPTPERSPSRLRSATAVTAALTMLVALIGAGVWLLAWSPVLAVSRVTVTGTKDVPEAAVVRAAQVTLGQPLARANLSQIQRRVETLVGVEAATVARTWPSTVTIAVTERISALAIEQDRRYLLVDPTGVVIRTAPRVPENLMVADVDPADTAVLREVAKVAGSLPPDLSAKVAAIKAATPQSVILTLSGRTTVIWGSAGQPDLKAQVTMALLKTKSRVIDVSAPRRPATRDS